MIDSWITERLCFGCIGYIMSIDADERFLGYSTTLFQLHWLFGVGGH